jgi:hypothetical protein
MMFMNYAGKWQLNVNQNAAKGWKTEVCIVCTNGEQDIHIDNYKAEQGNVCAFGYEEIKDPLPKTTTNFEYDGSQGS